MASDFKTQVWVGLLLLFAGAAINHFWSKYRNRLRKLRWSAWHTKIAVAAEDPYFGKVEVAYDGQQIVNVHTTFIQVVNESNADLKDIVLSICYLEGSRIYRAMGLLEGSILQFPFSDSFDEVVKRQYKNKQPGDDLYLQTHREFKISVFNRGARANFHFLVGRDDAAVPVATLECQHLGVRLTYGLQPGMLLGIPAVQALWAGLVFSLALTIWLALRFSSVWIAGVAGWTLGSFSTVVGVVLVHMWKWVGKQIE